MLISGSNNLSQIKNCLAIAHNFLLSQEEAVAIFEHQKTIIETNWSVVCEQAQLNEIDKKLLWGRQFLI